MDYDLKITGGLVYDGDGDEVTVVSFGGSSSNKHATTYFRKTFSVANPLAFSDIVVDLIRDDGAIVHLNGTEVFRTNMPGGSINYRSYASGAVGGSSESAIQSRRGRQSMGWR